MLIHRQTRHIRLGSDSDGHLIGVAQRATRTSVALIGGSDGKGILSPEIFGRFIVQVACQQLVEISQRPHQGDLAGTRPCTITAPVAPSKVSTPCSTRSTMETGALPASTSFTLTPESDRSHLPSPSCCQAAD